VVLQETNQRRWLRYVDMDTFLQGVSQGMTNAEKYSGEEAEQAVGCAEGGWRDAHQGYGPEPRIEWTTPEHTHRGRNLRAEAHTRDIALTRAIVSNGHGGPMVISAASWRHPPDRDTARRRLAGRWYYNQLRSQLRREREQQVLELLQAWGEGWGIQRRIARELQVHPSIVCRAVAALRQSLA
jgi:hypothetical protein